MEEYREIVRILESDLRWCLEHKDDKNGDENDRYFNRGYCGGRINLIKDLLSEIKVLQMQEELNNENR